MPAECIMLKPAILFHMYNTNKKISVFNKYDLVFSSNRKTFSRIITQMEYNLCSAERTT